MVSTELTRARRSQATLALDPIPASKAQSDPLKIAELDKHNLRRFDFAPDGDHAPVSTAPQSTVVSILRRALCLTDAGLRSGLIQPIAAPVAPCMR
jgi:hypothetical protein